MTSFIIAPQVLSLRIPMRIEHPPASHQPQEYLELLLGYLACPHVQIPEMAPIEFNRRVLIWIEKLSLV
jgi:hypothetical protein